MRNPRLVNVGLRAYPHNVKHSWFRTPSVSPNRRSVRIKADKERRAQEPAK